MYIDNIFAEIKGKLVEELNQTTLENFDRFNEWLKPNLKIIEQLQEISKINFVSNEVPNINTDIKGAEKVLVEEVNSELDSQEFILKEDLPIDTYPIGHILEFQKKAYGGVIEEMNYPIPEELVRKLHLENGNKVKIIGTKGNFADGKPIYDFVIVDRTNNPNPFLSEVKQGIVSEIAGRLVVTETTSGSIYFDEHPISLYISEKDSKKVEVGDIINGRFYTNNITNSFRVTFKYDTDSVEIKLSDERKKLQHRQNNQAEPTELGNTMMDRLDKTPFLNKRILLVGLRSRINDFKMITDRTDEIDFIHLSGDDHRAKTRAEILKSDIVLLSTQENSHETTQYVSSLCNSNSIPATCTHNTGLFSVLMDAKELIEKQDKQIKGA
ncbi:hypothetical protein ABFV99_13640 [Cytobacillus horneckiae]|uniref:hypothetical protein n=1 Tax=Cytobacillus horneckiae TaxID=549687 RepID=UPI0034CD40F1